MHTLLLDILSLYIYISESLGEHAERLDREDELVVRVGDHAASC